MRKIVSLDETSLDWTKSSGLIPAIVQDIHCGSILMQGYMNEEALDKTLELERVTFYSRSRQELWTKGDTSGNYLELIDIRTDCDGDSLLVTAKPSGPTCHLGQSSCFGDEAMIRRTGLLEELEAIIQKRMDSSDENSYTRSLMNEGTTRVAQKVGEEAVEVAIAATSQNDRAFLDETADLLYHLVVLVRSKGLSLADVEQVLINRRKSS